MRPAEAIPPHDPEDLTDAQALARLAEVSLILRTSSDFSTLVDVVTGVLRDVFSAQVCNVYLVDEQSGALRLWEFDDGAFGQPVIPTGGGLLSTVLLHEEPVYLTYPSRDGPRPESELCFDGCSEIVGLPLIVGQRLLGVMAASLSTRRSFTPSDRIMLGLLADSLAAALEQCRRYRDLEVVRDQIRQFESEAEERESLLGQMLSVVAHEMRTPLTAIKAYAEALLDVPDDQTTNRGPFLEIINEECDRLGRMLANALDYSRLESGQRSLHLTTLLPDDLIHDIMLTLGPESQKRNIRVEAEIPENFGSVEGDADLIKQLCLNLTSNAIKFSPEDATVSLRITGDSEHWRLDVRDRGIGIPEDQRSRIFERFYRVESDSARGVPGTGLGLAIARGIAELHGGRIWVAANSEGGSTFSVELPKVQRAPAEACQMAQGLWQHPAAKQFLDESTQIIAEVMQARIVSVMGVHPEEGDLRIKAALGLEAHARRRRVSYRGGIAGRALADGTPVLVNDIEADPRFQRPNHPQYFTKSLICVPIIVGALPVGVVNVNNKRSRQPFDQDDLTLLARLTDRLAIALERLRAAPDSKENIEEGLASLRALNPRHRELDLGRRSASDYVFALALRLGAETEEAVRLSRMLEPRVETLVPRTLKPVDDDAKKETVRKDAHALTVTDQNGKLGEFRRIALAVEECWDGSGQPHGLSNENIPLGARLLSVVNAFRSLTSGRPYRQAMSPSEAIKAIHAESGKRFDPGVVEELEGILNDESAEKGVGS